MTSIVRVLTVLVSASLTVLSGKQQERDTTLQGTERRPGAGAGALPVRLAASPHGTDLSVPDCTRWRKRELLSFAARISYLEAAFPDRLFFPLPSPARAVCRQSTFNTDAVADASSPVDDGGDEDSSRSQQYLPARSIV